MPPQEMIKLLNFETDPPPWDGEVQEIRATVMADRQPVQVRVLVIYKYAGRPMATVQAVQGKPFLETNMWFHTWNTDKRSLQLAFLKDVTFLY